MSDGLKNPKKDELLKLVSDAENKSASIQRMGQAAIEGAVQAHDVALCVREIFKHIPNDAYLPPEGWQHHIDGWRMWHKSADQVLRSANAIPTFTVATSTATATASSCVVGLYLYGSESQELPAVQIAVQKMETILGQGPLMQEVIGHMKRLGLDRSPPGQHSPLELLEEANAALQRPRNGEGSPIAVLIPLREAINSTLAELLRRRPRQEAARRASEKIKSIGIQCGRAEISRDVFVQQGKVADDLVDNLSGAKQEDMTRTQVIILFNSGLSFLKAFLEAINH